MKGGWREERGRREKKGREEGEGRGRKRGPATGFIFLLTDEQFQDFTLSQSPMFGLGCCR